MARTSMLYGSEIWSAALTKGRMYQLEVAQNKVLRVISGAFKATDVALLQKETEVGSVYSYNKEKRAVFFATQQVL